MSEDELNEFLRGENERLQKEQEKRIAERGDLPFLPTLLKGSTRLGLLRKIPKTLEPKPSDQFQTTRAAFSVEVRTKKKGWDAEMGREYAWTVNKNSPTYRTMLELLGKAPIDIEVIKTGEGKQTRYDVQAV